MVQRVHIDGLGRTKEDLLTYEIADVFRAKNLIDVGARVNCKGNVKHSVYFKSCVRYESIISSLHTADSTLHIPCTEKSRKCSVKTKVQA